MSCIDFTFANQKMILDLEQGILLGESNAKNQLLAILDAASVSTNYYGGDYSPIPAITINDPYHNIEQFATCLLFELSGDDYPSELLPYVPKWRDNKESSTRDEQLAAKLLDSYIVN